jgi:hypothetical protein
MVVLGVALVQGTLDRVVLWAGCGRLGTDGYRRRDVRQNSIVRGEPIIGAG